MHEPAETAHSARLAANAGVVRMLRGGARSEWSFVPSDGSFQVLAVKGKGLGAFATRAHRAGHRMFSEEPLLVWSVTAGQPVERVAFEKLVGDMDKPRRADLMSLFQADKHGGNFQRSAWGTWMSNAYPISGPDVAGSDPADPAAAAVFTHISRINHSCSPNCHVAWNAAIGRQTLHALHDIAVGEEITVTYVTGHGQARAPRQAYLREQFGFACRCSLCKLSGAALTQSDTRQLRIGALFAALPEVIKIATDKERSRTALGQAPSLVPRVAELVEEYMTLVAEEGQVELGENLHSMASFCKSVGHGQAAALWAHKAATCASVALGCDSKEYLASVALMQPHSAPLT
jgi:hypothetical protein